MFSQSGQLAPAYYFLMKKWNQAVNAFARMPMSIKKGLTTFTFAFFGLLMGFLCFNAMHDTLDEKDYVGLGLSLGAAAIMWSSITLHYTLKVIHTSIVYSYSSIAFVVLFGLFVTIQVLMFVAAEVVWILEGHFYEAVGGPYIARFVAYVAGPLWRDLSGLVKRTFTYYFSGAIEYHEEREYHRKKTLDSILEPVRDEVLEELLTDMTKVLSEDTVFWITEAGKDWDKEAREKIVSTRNELDGLLQVTKQQLVDIKAEQERLAKELVVASASVKKLATIVVDAVEDILSCIEDNAPVEQEAKLWLLNWRSGWSAQNPTRKSDYDSLDHVYLFGPMSHQEERLNVKDVLEDLVCTLEDTIEGEHGLEMPSISTFAADDEEGEKEDVVVAHLIEDLDEHPEPEPEPKSWDNITKAMSDIATLLAATSKYAGSSTEEEGVLSSVFHRADVSSLLTEVIDRLAAPRPATGTAVPVRDEDNASLLQSVFHRSLMSVKLAEMLDHVKEQAEKEERREHRRATKAILLSKLEGVYSEHRRGSLAFVGRHSYIPGLWSNKREDAVVTLLGELVDGLSAASAPAPAQHKENDKEKEKEKETPITAIVSSDTSNVIEEIIEQSGEEVSEPATTTSSRRRVRRPNRGTGGEEASPEKEAPPISINPHTSQDGEKSDSNP